MRMEWREYVPVGQRKAQAQRHALKLAGKRGFPAQPIEISVAISRKHFGAIPGAKTWRATATFQTAFLVEEPMPGMGRSLTWLFRKAKSRQLSAVRMSTKSKLSFRF